ncbi:hypothetical protein BJ973_000571 [Actinoplanes tereljensis]|uniref:Uncharacterized protein n=1 Tax=Paractinoplanes tereljensis TaxID=571912 RepID=A0A919NQ71_9ACTN|nr:hypothetical protein [Actinoplanes tereljensis]GIF23071.1 hypothetical protein Ate02nite_58010 [Actinoplanes tereljensis]
MTNLDAYAPPGGLTDLSPEGRRLWSDYIAARVDDATSGRPQFYNLLRTETAADATEAPVSWTAFPRKIKLNSISDVQRWDRADAGRDVQDEYCEWSITRDESGKITRVTFTCEGPEYWDVLAKTSPDTALRLYQEHISPEVRRSDLFDPAGEYVRENRWNNSTTHGAMHLIQAANTLGAEIELAAAASNRRVIGGVELTGEQELINCAGYGDPERNSDPHIGAVVNSVARSRADVTLADPVGLYFDDLATDGWAAPDGSDPKSYWTYVRGDANHPVRAVYEVPADRGFAVGDLTIGGEPIEFGAQIADFITIKLVAVACRFGQSTAEPETSCIGSGPVHTFLPGRPSRATRSTRTTAAATV